MNNLLDVIVPVYNEAANIENNLDAIQKGISGCTDHVSVNIVYDFEQDSTLPVVEQIQSKYSFPIYLIKNTTRGVCQAIKTGFDKAEGEFLLVTMADMSDDYTILPQMVELAKKGNDIVCGSRYMKGGKTHGGPFLKQNLSRLAGLSLHAITGIPTHDITNSYKIYRKSLLRNINIESEGGFEVGMEITAKAFLQGYKIAEIPSQWWDRTQGQSRFQLMRWLPKYLRWYTLLLSKIFAKKK